MSEPVKVNEESQDGAIELPTVEGDGPNFPRVDGPYKAWVASANNPGYEVFVSKPSGRLETFVGCGLRGDKDLRSRHVPGRAGGGGEDRRGGG